MWVTKTTERTPLWQKNLYILKRKNPQNSEKKKPHQSAIADIALPFFLTGRAQQTCKCFGTQCNTHFLTKSLKSLLLKYMPFLLFLEEKEFLLRAAEPCLEILITQELDKGYRVLLTLCRIFSLLAPCWADCKRDFHFYTKESPAPWNTSNY